MPSNKENLLLKAVSDINHGILDTGLYRLGYYIAKNKEKSAINEDVLFCHIDKKGMVLGVSDGAGGHPRGADAAAIVGEEVLSKAQDVLEKGFNPLQLIEDINAKILALKAGAKTTLALITLYDDSFRAYSVGDSEVVFWNTQSTEVYTNVPDSTTGYRVQAGDLEQKEALDAPDRHIVYNMLGDKIYKTEVSSSIETKKGNTILVGTDGLFDNFSHEDLRQILSSGKFEEAFDAIVQICSSEGTQGLRKDDDIAFFLIRKIKSN
tara:strand:+ start:1562 stop:2356 length:795 start_codon:yes stop_codon:yes gene_type:complete